MKTVKCSRQSGSAPEFKTDRAVGPQNLPASSTHVTAECRVRVRVMTSSRMLKTQQRRPDVVQITQPNNVLFRNEKAQASD